MKVGDLVKMKFGSWWEVRNRKKEYTDLCGIVYSIAGRGIKVLMPDGAIKIGLADHWETIQES